MYSGWGGVVYTLDSNGVTTEFLKTKQTWMIESKYVLFHYLNICKINLYEVLTLMIIEL
jgi:hypothetical protein